MVGGSVRRRNLLAADADRDRVVAELREHCAAGRLTLEEFSERMEHAYAARTYGALEACLHRLPPVRMPLAAWVASRQRSDLAAQARRLRWHARAYVAGGFVLVGEATLAMAGVDLPGPLHDVALDGAVWVVWGAGLGGHAGKVAVSRGIVWLQQRRATLRRSFL